MKKKVVKFVLLPLFVLFAVIFAVVWYLAYTNIGANFVFNTAKSSLNGIVNIQGELKGGTIAKGLSFDNLIVQVPDIIDIKADSLDLSYNLNTLIFKRTLNVEHLKSQNLFISLLIKSEGEDKREQKERANNKPFKLKFPFAINLNDLDVNTFFYISEHVDVKLLSLKANANIKDSDVKVNRLFVSDIDVLYHDEKSKSNDVVNKIATTVEQDVDGVTDKVLDPHKKINVGKSTFSNVDKSKDFISLKEHINNIVKDFNKNIAKRDNTKDNFNLCNIEDNVSFFKDDSIKPLYKVVLPISVYVGEFEVQRGRYSQFNFDTGDMDLKLKGSFVDTKVNVEDLQVVHQLGSAQLKGSMLFENYYTIKASLNAVGAISDYTKNNYEGILYGLQGNIDVDGDLRDLRAKAKISNKDLALIDLRFSALGNGLPLNLKIKSDRLAWPLMVNTPKAEVKNLSLCSIGKILHGLDTKVVGNISGYGFKNFSIDLKGLLSTQRSTIDNLDLHGIYNNSRTNLNFKGNIEYGSFYQALGTLKAKTENAAFLNQMLNGALNLDSKFYVKVDPNSDNLIETNIDNVNGSFILNGQKSDILVSNLLGSYKDGFTFDRIEATQGKNRMHFNGFIGFKESDLKGTIDLKDLYALTNYIDGSFIGSFKATGKLSDLHTNITGKSKSIKNNQGLEIKDFFFNAILNTRDLSFNTTALASTVQLTEGIHASKQCVIDLNGVVDKHTLNFVCGGKNSGFLTFKGGFNQESKTYTGLLSDFVLSNQVGATLALQSPVDVSYDFTKNIAKVDGIKLNGDVVSIDIEETNFNNGDLTTGLKLYNLSLKELNYLMPDDTKLLGNVTIDTKVNIQKNIPNIHAFLDVDGLVIKNKDIDLHFENLNANVNTDNKKALANLDFAFKDNMGKAHVDLTVSDPFNKKYLSGLVDVKDINLSLFENAGQAFNELEGFANIQGNLKGTLEKPLFYGDINIKGNGEPRYDVGQIDNFNVNVKALGSSGNIDGFINLNKTPLNLAGHLNWEKAAYGDLSLKAKHLPAFLLGYGSAFTNIDMHASLKDSISVTGLVEVPEAYLTVKGLSGSGVSVSKDEILIDKKGITGRKKKSQSNIKTALDINIKIGDKVKASAMGLISNVGGGIQIIKSLEKDDINAKGRVYLKDGKIELYGRHFNVVKANTIFSGPIANPELDVEVIVAPDEIEDDVEAGIRVTGFASDPVIKLFSKPSMTDNEVLSYILYGHSLEKSTTDKNQGISSGALILGLGLNSTTTLVNALVGSIGIQNFQIGASGSGSDAKVSVQGYLTPRVKVSYGYGVFSQIGEFKLRYEIIRKLYAEFVSSIDQAVDLIYSFEFD